MVAALLAAPAPAGAQLLSPGKLTQSHASLDGDEGCSNCHSSGKQVDDKKCLKCHDDLAARIAQSAGLHGRNYKGQDCSRCHVDHLGRKAQLIRWPGGDKARLDHALTGWPLDGAHTGKECKACHDRSNARGNDTFLGAPTACESCHEDPHGGRMGGSCAGCHTSEAWKKVDLSKFDHARAAFKLAGKHRGVGCKACHGEPAKWTGIPFESCSSCHADPHEGRLRGRCESCHTVDGWDRVEALRKKHPWLSLKAGHAGLRCAKCHDKGSDKPPSKGKDCVDCHRPVHEANLGRDCNQCHAGIKWLGLSREVGLDAHRLTPFPLRGRHEPLDCAKCHPPKLPAKRRFRELTFDTCAACHADRHDGRLAPRFGDCASCHTEEGFVPTTFGPKQHAATAFALDGRHDATPCARCHPGPAPRLDLRVGKQACADCHADPHGGQFAKEMEQGGCTACHSTDGWERPRIDHSSWPLTGAHERVDCASCHGKTAGAADPARYRGVPRACDGCHEDVHAGQFRLSQPVRACDACHATEAFAIAAFDHTGLGGWPLDGEHRGAPCARCHTGERLRNGVKATRWRLGYRSCKGCHVNPHVEERRGERRRRSFLDEIDCVECHTSGGWRLSATATGGGFDHARTGFPLRDAHADAGCMDCHGGGMQLASECVTCHQDTHAGRLGTDCAECHSAVAWDDTRTLEDHRRTRLPLTGRHALAACTDCHLRTTERAWSDVPADCFACHEDEYRADLHPSHQGDPADPASEPFPRDCGQCHRPTGWSPAVIVPLAATLQRRAAAAGHEASFPIASGKHHAAACVACHPVAERPRMVACDGCHEHAPLRMRLTHARVGGVITGCLGCHPAGVAR